MQTATLGQKIKTKARQVFRLTLIILLLGAAGYFSFQYWAVYDEGIRAGTVLRISKKGLIFKTYEGQLNLQTFGALKGTSPIMESFDFSVESDQEQVIHDLEEAALSGERVNLHYIKRYAIFPWRGDTKYFITRVERGGR